MSEALVYAAVRTPRGAGKPRGSLSGVRPIELLAQLMAALVERTGVEPALVEDVILGCSTQTGEQGANLARIAALYAGWGESVPGVTLNRFCASGLSALVYAAAKVRSGVEGAIVAGGIESMSRVPILSDGGAWFSDPEVAARTGFVHMGVAADLLATLRGYSRERLDGLALSSHRRACSAQASGDLQRSMIPVRAPDGAVLLDRDETVRPGLSAASLAALPVAFAELGSRGGDRVALARYPSLRSIEHLHTVGSSPALADGAALLLIGDAALGERLGLRPRARVRATAEVAVEPTLMLTGMVPAVERALGRAGLHPGDVDRFEANESFAAPVLDLCERLALDPERVNPWGGALALGHPIGATGAVLVTTLLDGLEQGDGELGVATICAGAGLAAAVVLERV